MSERSHVADIGRLTGKRLLVCGSRNFRDAELVDLYLTNLAPTSIISGGARGADELAIRWGRSRGIPCNVYLPDWTKFGKAAGPIRNKQMLTEGTPDVVLAFPGMRGTANMVSQARTAGLPILDAEGDTIEVTDAAFGGRKSGTLNWRTL